MKITAQRRLPLLAGLLLLAMIVFATGVQAAQAATVAGSGAGSGTASLTTHISQPQGLTGAQRSARGGRLAVNIPAAQSGSLGTSSRTAWIAAGLAAAALIVIAAWVLSRRRRRPGGRPSAAYCARHPEDPLCTTA